MINVRNFILNIQIWTHRICGFRKFNFNGKFEKDKSLAIYYPILILLCFLGNDVIRHIGLSNRIKNYGTNTFRKTVLIHGFTLIISSVITILSESYVFINEKEKIYNNFKNIHTILLARDFQNSFIFERSTYIFSIFTVSLIVRSCLYEYVKHANINKVVQITIFIEYLVVAFGVLEISANIRACKDYVSALNESIIFQTFKKKIDRKNDLDFRSTRLRAKDSTVQDLFLTYKQSPQIKDFIQVFEMINENMKLISRRYTGIVRMF